MNQLYSCPNCGTPIAYAESPCRYCGVYLTWPAPQPPQPPTYPGGGQDGYSTQAWHQQAAPVNQQEAWNQNRPYDNPPGWVGQGQNNYGYSQDGDDDAQTPRRPMRLLIFLIVLMLAVAGGAVLVTKGNLLSSSIPGQPGQTVASNAVPRDEKPPTVKSFTATPVSVPAGQPSTLQWATDGADSVSIEPGIGASALTGIAAVSPATATTYMLTATNTAGSVTASVSVAITPPGLPVVTTFTASPDAIKGGSSSSLQWNVTGASSVSIDHGVGAVATAGTTPVSPTDNTTYTLTASSGAGSVTSKASISVTKGTPPRITGFTATPAAISENGSSTLQWSTMGASTVEIDHGLGPVGPTGTLVVSPVTTTTYKLSATNAGSLVTATAVVTVAENQTAAIALFTASPGTVTAGQSATLRWNVTNATSVTITPGVGEVGLTGTQEVSPPTHTTYTLTASNPGGSTTATFTVMVTTATAPAINSFAANPATISAGQPSTLQWSVADATSVSINHEVGDVPLTSTTSVTPGATTTYTLTATGSTGSSTATTTITVVPAGMPIVSSFNASPGTIAVGGSTTLDWNVTGADSISIDHSIGLVNASGTATITLSDNTTYTLTAVGSAGSATRTAAVTVIQP